MVMDFSPDKPVFDIAITYWFTTGIGMASGQNRCYTPQQSHWTRGHLQFLKLESTTLQGVFNFTVKLANNNHNSHTIT